MSVLRDFRQNARMHGAPVTVAIVVLLIASFLLNWMRVAPEFWPRLAFTTLNPMAAPWSLVTYPYFELSPIGLVFVCMWLWGIGGSVERDLGSSKYALVWILFGALCAISLWVGSVATGLAAVLSGAWIPVSVITVIWGTRNPTAQILLMFVIPILGRWLAWLSAFLVFFGVSDPKLAPFAAAPLAIAYFFAANKLPFFAYSGSIGGRRGHNPAGTRKVYNQGYYEEVKRREQAREEKERLRRMFESSLSEDPDKDR